MRTFYEAFEREKTSDVKHYGTPGMRWGVVNKQEAKGGVRGGIIRGMEKSADASNLETWDLRDRVDRMKAESDYRKLVEERETYAAQQAEKIKSARREKVLNTVRNVSLALGTVATTIGLVKSIQTGGSKFKRFLNDRRQMRI